MIFNETVTHHDGRIETSTGPIKHFGNILLKVKIPIHDNSCAIVFLSNI